MKVRTVGIVVALWLFSGKVMAENQFPNPDFEHGLAGYMLGDGCRFEYREHRFIPLENGNALEIVFRPSDNPWGYALRNDVGLFTPEVPVPPGTAYEFRFTAKSSVPGQNIICGEYTHYQGDVSVMGKTRQFTLSKHPKTFSVIVKNDSDAVRWSGFRIFRRIDRSAVSAERESIVLSNLRFGPVGSLETNRRRHSVSLAVDGDPMSLNYHPGEKIMLRLTMLNRQHCERKGKAVLRMRSSRNNFLLECRTLELVLPPGKSEKVVTLTVPERYGCTRIEGTFEDEPFINSIKFAISPLVRLKTGDLPLDLGTNNIMSLPEDKFHLQEQMKLLADGGFTRLRVWDTGNCFAWHSIEPEDGRFDWKKCDRYVAAARKENLEILPVLGGQFLLNDTLLPWGRRQPFGAELPIWLYQKSEKTVSGTIPRPNRKTVLPPMKYWERMVREVAKRYSKDIHSWEILNESEIYLSNQLYVPYLIRAYQILKEEVPGCTVIGGGLTGDFDNDIAAGLEEFMRLAGKHTDGLSFHPYGSLYEDAGRMPSGMLFSRAAECFRKLGTVLPLWNTEVYYLNPESSGGGAHGIGPVFDPGYQVRRYLVDAANGVKVATMLCGRYMLANLINDNVTGNRLGAFFANRILPGDKYVVSALFAKNMKGFRYEKTLSLSGRLLAYVFRNGTRRTAYLFSLSVRKNDSRIIRFPVSGNVECRDLFDELLPSPSGKPSPIPFRVSGEAEEVDRFLNAICTAGDLPILFYGMRLVRTPDRRMDLYVDAAPCASDELQVESCEPELLKKTREVRKIRIPQTLAARFNKLRRASLEIGGEKRSGEISQCYRIPELARAPEFNPELNDKIWSSAWSHNVGTGKIYLAKFGGSLYFACSVKKEKLYRNMADPAIYLSDSVELFLDGKPFENLQFARYAKSSRNTRQLMFLPPFGDRPARVSGNAGEEWKGLKWRFKVYPGHYNLIVTIPLSAFCASEKELFGFDCAINSWIKGTLSKYTLSRNKEIFMNRLQFNLIKIIPQKAGE